MRKIFKVKTLIICLIIIYFSSKSGDISSNQSTFVQEFLKSLGLDFKSIGLNIRKVAHFIIYFALGFSFTLSKHKKALKMCFFNLFIVFLFACSDEFHQSFTPGRGPSVKDIALDSIGAFFGIFIAYYLYIIYKKSLV